MFQTLNCFSKKSQKYSPLSTHPPKVRCFSEHESLLDKDECKRNLYERNYFKKQYINENRTGFGGAEGGRTIGGRRGAGGFGRYRPLKEYNTSSYYHSQDFLKSVGGSGVPSSKYVKDECSPLAASEY